MSKTCQLSAIIPVLDEAEHLSALLAVLRPEVDELVVVDGGSEDDSVAIARRAGASVVLGPRGRGPQLIAGVKAARGELLWFLHADSRISSGSGDAIRSAAAAGGRWGCLSVRIDSGDPRLWLAGHGMTLRARLTGSCTGDMAMWATRTLYDAVGGFDDLVAFEDLVFADRARRIAPCTLLPVYVQTSARRWETRGVWRTITWMWLLRLLYRSGMSPKRLATLYQQDRG